MATKTTSNNNIELGTLVISRCGRDLGRHYLVVAKSTDADHCLCSDGNVRKLNNPKKKRIKHLMIKASIQSIKDKLIEDKKVFDSEVFSAIKVALDQTE